MSSNPVNNSHAMDILRSGAIYQLKDVRSLKSPPVIKINKDSSSSLTDIVPDINPEEIQHVNERFELTYRATSSPALHIYQRAIMNSRHSHTDNSAYTTDSRYPIIPNLLSPSSGLLISNPYSSPSPAKLLRYSPPNVMEIPNKADASNVLKSPSPCKSSSTQTEQAIAPSPSQATSPIRHLSPKKTAAISIEVQTDCSFSTHEMVFVETTLASSTPSSTAKPQVASTSRPPSTSASKSKSTATPTPPATAISPAASKFTSPALVAPPTYAIQSASSSATATSTGSLSRIHLQTSSSLLPGRSSAARIDSLMTLFSPSKPLTPPTSLSIPPATTQPMPTIKPTTSTAAANPDPVTLKPTRSGRQPQPINRLVDELNSSSTSMQGNIIPDTSSSTTRKRSRPTEHIQDPSSSSSSTTLSNTSSSSSWLPQEFTALYTAYGKTEVTAPDFWTQVASELQAAGIRKTAKQCQDRWFLSLQETEERRRKKLTSTAMSKAQSVPAVSTTSILGSYSLEDNKFHAKKKLSKATMKKLAEDAMFSEPADDLFDAHDSLAVAPLQRNRTPSSSSITADIIKNPIFNQIKSPIDAVDDDDDDMQSVASKATTVRGIGAFARPAAAAKLSHRAESGKQSYITNLKKRVRAFNTTSSSTEKNISSKAPASKNIKSRRVRDDDIEGVMSPSTGRIRISRLTSASDDDQDDDDNFDEDDD